MEYDIITNGDEMKKRLIILLLTSFLFTGCQSETTYQEYRNSTFTGFNTVFTLLGYTQSKEEFNTYFSLMEEKIWYYHCLFDKYNTYAGVNNIKTINDQAGIAPVKVDPEIIELLLIAKEWYAKTDGYFDITLGAVLNIWHNYREEGILLNQDGLYGKISDITELEQAKQFTGWEYVEIDELNSTVYLANSAVALDVGGVAKGFTVEKIAILLEAAGLQYGIVNGGGNVRTIHSKPGNKPFNNAIKEPDTQTDSYLDVIQTRDSTSVITSGDYERYYLATDSDNNIYRIHHIINPYSLMPYNHVRAVTVITNDSTIGDILSTYFSLLSFEEGITKVAQLKKEGINVEVIWIFESKQENHSGVSFFEKNGFYIYLTDGLKKQSVHFNP